MTASPATAEFLAKLLAVEEAWALLDAVERADDKAGQIALAVARGGHATQVLIRAGEMLAGSGADEAALRTLEGGLALDGPTAPLQAALARHCRAMGDLDGAARWLRGAMLRARPDAALLAALAAVELEAGQAGCAEAIVAVLGRFPGNDTTGLATEGRRLSALGRPDLALAPFIVAFARGCRDQAFVADFGALLARDGLPQVDAAVQLLAGATAAHLKLSAQLRDDPIVAVVHERAASAAWLDADGVQALLGAAITRAKPFSWIRLGDGEARFLLWHHAEYRDALSEGEAGFVGRLIWQNWFGQDPAGLDPDRLAALAAQFDAAVARADLLGVTSPARLAAEREHFGSLVALERHVARLAPRGRPSDAYASLTVNERDPFFASLLGGLDFLGVISPHPDLADRLGDRLGIGRTAAWVIPGESRLAHSREAADRGTHFPDMFDRLMAEIAVPREGAVFLVAGGLLGKIYCDRIKQLGGIALDVGAAVDAWMGRNTRGIVLDRSMEHRLV